MHVNQLEQQTLIFSKENVKKLGAKCLLVMRLLYVTHAHLHNDI